MWCFEPNKDTRFEYGRRRRSRPINGGSRNKNSSNLRGSAYSRNSGYNQSRRESSVGRSSSHPRSRSKNTARKVSQAFNSREGSLTPNNQVVYAKEQKNFDTQNVKFSEMNRTQTEHLAYRELMLRRLQSVGLNEDEFEEYIRMDQHSLLNNLNEIKLKALMIVINKEDFKNNFDFSDEQYAFYERKFNLTSEKNQRIHDPSFNKLTKKVEEYGGNEINGDELNESSIYSLPRFGSKMDKENRERFGSVERNSSLQKGNISPQQYNRRSTQSRNQNVFRDITNTENKRLSINQMGAETINQRQEKETKSGSFIQYPTIQQLDPYQYQTQGNEPNIPSFGNSVIPGGGQAVTYGQSQFGGQSFGYDQYVGNPSTQQGPTNQSQYNYYSDPNYDPNAQYSTYQNAPPVNYVQDGLTPDGEVIYDVDPNTLINEGDGDIRPQPQPNIRPGPQPIVNPQPRPQPYIQPNPQPRPQPRPQPYIQPVNPSPAPPGYFYNQDGYLELIPQDQGIPLNNNPPAPTQPGKLTITENNQPHVIVRPRKILPTIQRQSPKKAPAIFIKNEYKDVRLLQSQAQPNAPQISLTASPIATPRGVSHSPTPINQSNVLRNSNYVVQATIPTTITASQTPRRYTTNINGGTTVRQSFVQVSSPIQNSPGYFPTTSTNTTPFRTVTTTSPYLSARKETVVTTSPMRSPRVERLVSASPIRSNLRSSNVIQGSPITIVQNSNQNTRGPQSFSNPIPQNKTVYSKPIVVNNPQTNEYGFQPSRRVPTSRVVTQVQTTTGNSQSTSVSRVINLRQSNDVDNIKNSSVISSRSRNNEMALSGYQKKKIKLPSSNAPRYDKVVITGENRSQSRSRSPYVTRNAGNEQPREVLTNRGNIFYQSSIQVSR